MPVPIKTARPLAQLRAGAPWYRIQASAGSGKAVIHIMDEIGWFGVSAAEFTRELNALDVEQIDVHLSSPGGDVFDAIAIFQGLRNHKAAITTYVDSLAASAASFIALAGDRRIVAPYGSLMIHDAWGMAIGNAADMAKMSQELEKVSANLANIYADRAGGNADDWRALMRDETWFDAKEAVAAGLMHEVQADTDKSAQADTQNRWDLSVFNFAGRANAPAPRIAALSVEPPSADSEPSAEDPADDVTPDQGTELPAAEPEPLTEPKEDLVSTLSTDVRSRLGLEENADDAAVLAAIEALQTQPDPEPTPEPEPDPALVAANNNLNEKVSQLTEQVQQMGAELAAAKAEKASSIRASILDNAQKSGKFAPADRSTWEARYDRAPEVTAEVLASIPDGTAVPVDTSGYTGEGEPASGDDFDEIMKRLDGPLAVKGGN